MKCGTIDHVLDILSPVSPLCTTIELMPFYPRVHNTITTSMVFVAFLEANCFCLLEKRRGHDQRD